MGEFSPRRSVMRGDVGRHVAELIRRVERLERLNRGLMQVLSAAIESDSYEEWREWLMTLTPSLSEQEQVNEPT